MNKTLKISFSLKNTYRVNGVLFSLKQIPLVKRLLPATLYQVKGLKIFANILSVLWEIVSVFLGKFLYFITMVCLQKCMQYLCRCNPNGCCIPCGFHFNPVSHFFGRYRSGFDCTFRAYDKHKNMVCLPDELSVLSDNGGVWESC